MHYRFLIQCEVDFKYVFTVRFDPLREQLVADVFLFLERLASKIQGGAPYRYRYKLVYVYPSNYITTINRLVGGFKHVLFSIIYGIILPIDFHSFQDG